MPMMRHADFTGVLDRDVTEEIILNVAAADMPLYAAIVGAGQRSETMTQKFEWQSADLAARRTQVNGAGFDQNTTAITVDSGAIFYANCMVLAEATGEVMFCRSVVGNVITVVRGVGTIVAASAGSVADNAFLRNCGPAMVEGSDLPSARHVGSSLASNWVQTLRKPVELSGRLGASATLTENERARQRQSVFAELERDIEHAIVFGAADGDTTDASGVIATSTGGILQSITTKIDNVGGAMSLSRFHTFADLAFEFGSPEKWMLCGSTVLGAIHDLYLGKLEVRSAEGAAGLKLRSVLTPYGTLNLLHHRQFTGSYAGYGVVVDPAQVEVRYMAGDRGLPHLREDVRRDGKDAIVDEWFAELGLQWGSEKHHAVMKGVTGAA